MQSLRWDEPDYIGWLRTGFERLEADAGTPEEHLAFFPLRLNLELSVRGQLLGVFQILRERHPRLAEALRHAISTQIREWERGGLQDSEIVLAIEFWRSLPPLCPPGDLMAQVRLFLRTLERFDLPQTEQEELVRVLVQAVSSTPVNQMHLRFFEDLFDAGQHWRDEFMRLLTDRYLAWREADMATAWYELQMQFPRALDQAASVGEPGGRAFIAHVARRLFPKLCEGSPPKTVDQWALLWAKMRSTEIEEGIEPLVYVEIPEAKAISDFPALARFAA